MNRRQRKKLVRRMVEEMDTMTDDLRTSLATRHATARQTRHAEMDRATLARIAGWRNPGCGRTASLPRV